MMLNKLTLILKAVGFPANLTWISVVSLCSHGSATSLSNTYGLRFWTRIFKRIILWTRTFKKKRWKYIFQKYPPTCEFGLNNNIIRGSPNPIINPRHSDMNIHTLVCSHPPHKHNSAYADPVTDFTVTIVTHSLIAEVVMERKSISEAVTQWHIIFKRCVCVCSYLWF